MKSVLNLLSVLAVIVAVCSCDDPLTSGDGNRTRVTVTVDLPDLPDEALIVDRIYTFQNMSTGKTSEFSPNGEINLIAGLYDVSFTAKVFTPGVAQTTLRANRQSVDISGENCRIELKAYNNRESDDLIIVEVFFAGTLQPSGNNYYGDDYIKLYNNTDHIIYADGIVLFESKFLTTKKQNYTPDIMAEAMTVQALYQVPGNGTDVPVAPGEYLLLADTGIDHRVANPNSFDLSHADFEWYDVSTKPSDMDIDGAVDNLDKWYCYTQSYWILHNRGFRTFGIARIPVEREVYLKDYYYTYEYDEVTNVGTFPMSQSAYRMPNEWISDAVTTSVASEYAWQVCAPSVDCGWTNCGTIDRDKTRYFHSVRRKLLLLTDDGRAVFQDTNNSTSDFNPMCIPSEIEVQGTAIDAQGTKCTTHTYDGVINR